MLEYGPVFVPSDPLDFSVRKTAYFLVDEIGGTWDLRPDLGSSRTIFGRYLPTWSAFLEPRHAVSVDSLTLDPFCVLLALEHY